MGWYHGAVPNACLGLACVRTPVEPVKGGAAQETLLAAGPPPVHSEPACVLRGVRVHGCPPACGSCAQVSAGPQVPLPAPGEPPFPVMQCPPSVENPFLFVHLPKSAGTTIREALQCVMEGQEGAACTRRALGDRCEGGTPPPRVALCAAWARVRDGDDVFMLPPASFCPARRTLPCVVFLPCSVRAPCPECICGLRQYPCLDSQAPFLVVAGHLQVGRGAGWGSVVCAVRGHPVPGSPRPSCSPITAGLVICLAQCSSVAWRFSGASPCCAPVVGPRGTLLSLRPPCPLPSLPSPVSREADHVHAPVLARVCADSAAAAAAAAAAERSTCMPGRPW
jgi:hypothetical protein